MNEGYSFEPEDKFSWEPHHLREERFNKLKSGLFSLKSMCASYSKQEDTEDAMFLRAMSDVLESLERTLIHHFDSAGHIVSPKSDEPWD